MKNNILILLILSLNLQLIAQKSIDTKFNLKWKKNIGVTTYRTNMILSGGVLFIGSNGEDRNLDLDELDGVYALDAKTGAVKWHFQPELIGDNDVNGLAVSDNYIYFGTDNYYFFCIDKISGELIWKKQTPSDVESTPALAFIDGDRTADVIYSVENNGIYARSGSSGEMLWKHDTIGTSGNNSPLAIDINKDGVKDIIIGGRTTPYTDRTAGFVMEHYGDYYFAFDGKDGAPIWQIPFGSNLHASPIAYYTDSNELRMVLVSAYCEIRIIDKNGETIYNYTAGHGCFGTPAISGNEGYISNSKSWFDGGSFAIHKLEKDASNEIQSIASGVKSKVSASAAVADVSGDSGLEFVSVSEDGFLLIVPENKNEKPYQLKLTSGAEATPFIGDVDGDGKLEIIVSCLDGNLYCYSTNRKGKVVWEGFRGGRMEGVFSGER